MTRTAWRTMVLSLMLLSVLHLSQLPATAQVELPDPPDTEDVKEAVDGSVGDVESAVGGAGGTAEETSDQVGDTTDDVVGGVAGGGDGGNGGGGDLTAGATGSVPQVTQGSAGSTSASGDPHQPSASGDPHQASGGSPPNSGVSKSAGEPGAVTPTGGSLVAKHGQIGEFQESPPRILVQKTNDADGDGVFSRDEVAPSAGKDTRFRISIQNVGQHAVIVQTITDTFSMRSVEVCEFMMSMRIESGHTQTCTFTLDDYSPPSHDTRGNLIRVTVRGNPSGTITASDVSTVTTVPGGAAQGGAADPRLPLASTGWNVIGLSLVALALMTAGSFALGWGRRRGSADTAAASRNAETEPRPGPGASAGTDRLLSSEASRPSA
jgi:hypothetical protein